MSDFSYLRKSLPPSSRANFDEGLERARACLQAKDPIMALAELCFQWMELQAEMTRPQAPMTPEETLAAVSAIARIPGDDQMRAIEFLGKHHGLIVERKFTASKQERTVRVIYDTGKTQMLVAEPEMGLLEDGMRDDNGNSPPR